jgi:hypothetical protein
MWFIDHLRARLANRFQLTSDGHRAYMEAVEGVFGSDVDYAASEDLRLVAGGLQRSLHSPADCTGIKKTMIEGKPDPEHVSTSYIERNNPTMRMHMRRFTRLTNAFSKKVENHAYAVALHMMYYNFVRMHSTLRMTPERSLAFRIGFGKCPTSSRLLRPRKPRLSRSAGLTKHR